MELDIRFLDNQVRQQIELDVVEVSRNPAEQNAALFGVPRQVFCFVDYLGSVAYNNLKRESQQATTRKAIRFIKEFFPSAYSDKAELLVAMWRHGTVHALVPYIYYTLSGNRKKLVKWSTNNDWTEHNRAVHLQFFDIEGDPDSICLSINVCELADDLLLSLDALLDRMRANPAFGRGCISRLNRIHSHVYVDRKGLRLSAKAQVKSQMLAAVGLTAGVIRGGDQVEWYE